VTALPQDPVVVITGASSGIGRATALAFAEQGARLVVTGRREEPLRRLVDQCAARGGQALAVPVDVTDADAVVRVAQRAVERWGRLDVWVNNAAVNAFSSFGEEPVDVPRRVLEVNALGQLHGARAALPLFRDQGSGVLVNVGSVLSRIPSPYQSSYVMSKHAVRALSGCLRQELQDAPGVRVCTVLPGAVDTPLFDAAANWTGWAVKPLRPVYAPERVAAAIVSCAHRPRDEVVVGLGAKVMVLQSVLAPRLTERIIARVVRRGHFQDSYAPQGEGNLFDAQASGSTVRGGWKDGGTARLARRVALAGAALLLPAAVGRCRR
jgi:short-subunit dehydrogenase